MTFLLTFGAVLLCCAVLFCAAGPEEDWEATPADFRGVVTHIKEK
jgi:hypothetical protein